MGTARHRNALPQLAGGFFVTDGGIETSLLFGLLRWRVTSGEGFDMLPPALPGPGWPEQEEPSEAVESRTFF